MKLYIDDIREAPDESWTLVRTISEAVRFIARYGSEITHISLDHDISYNVQVEGVYRPFPSPETYQPIAYFIGNKYCLNFALQDSIDFKHPEITIHSSNQKGSEEMKHILAEYGIPCELNPMGPAYRKQ